MKDLINVFITECLKLRRSAILGITIFIFILIPIMMSLMMLVAKNPDISAKLGLIGTKASLFTTTDWTGFFGILIQSIATIGFIGFGFVCSWVFGREYSDRTIKDFLALPVSRTSIVIAKFIVVIIWCSILSLVLFVIGLISGHFIGLGSLSSEIATQFSIKYFMTVFLTLFLVSPVAFFASYGRGIVAPLGFVIITLVIAQFVAIVGLGPYFPWAIPGVYTAAEGTQGMQLVTLSYVLLVGTFILGFLGTIAWWRYADQH